MKTIHQLRITAVIGAALMAVSVSAATLTRTATGNWDLTTVAWTNAVTGGPNVAWDNEAWNTASVGYNSVTVKTNINLGGLTITVPGITISADSGKRLIFATGAQLRQNEHFSSTVSASIAGTNLVKVGSRCLILSGTANELVGDFAVADGFLQANNNTVLNGLTSMTVTNTGTYIANGNYTTNSGLTVRLAGTGNSGRGSLHFYNASIIGTPVELINDTRLGIGGEGNSSMATGETRGGTVNRAISGAYGIEFASRGATGSTGVVELASANTFSGASTLARIDGTSITVLRLSHADALQASTYNNTVSYGLLQFSGLSSATFGGLAGNQPLALANLAGGAVTLTVGNNNTSTAFSGALSGTGALTKTGSGTLTLSTNNTYTGVTSVNAGILKLGVSNTLWTGTAALVGSNAVLDVNAKVQALSSLGGSGLVTNNSLLTVAGEIIPGGTNGIGTLTLAVPTTTPLSGVLRIQAAADGSCDRLHVQGGSLDISGLSLEVTGTLNKSNKYTVVTCTGALNTTFSSASLPPFWLVRYNTTESKVFLTYNAGTMIRFF